MSRVEYSDQLRPAALPEALLLENSDQPPEHAHQTLARADVRAGRDEVLVEDEMSGTVAHDASDRQPDRSLRDLLVEK
jgi:hypothetical protein